MGQILKPMKKGMLNARSMTKLEKQIQEGVEQKRGGIQLKGANRYT